MVRRLLCLSFCFTSLVVGCHSEFDPMLTSASSHTFGEKFFTISCQRVAYTSSLGSHKGNAQVAVDVSGTRYRQACRYGPTSVTASELAVMRAKDPKVAVLLNTHAPMVKAVDMIFPGTELSDLQDYMVSILPLTDNGKFPSLVRKGAEAIGEMEKDTHLQWSLARLEGRVGYRPRKVCMGVMREMLQYPRLHELLNSLLTLTAEGGKGHQPLLDLIEALSLELRTVKQAAPGDKERTLKLALDLLLTHDSRFSTGSPTPLLITRRDWRGMATVLADPKTKQLPSPFVDKNNDGLADVDPTFRSFLTQPSGAQIPMPFVLDTSKQDYAPKRDGQGRALAANGQPIYDYVNLDNTLLAALSRDATKIMDPKKRTGTRLVLGLGALLGPRQKKNKSYTPLGSLDYSGYDTQASPALDLVHAVLQVLGDPAIDETLDAATQLLEKHEQPTARLLAAAFDAKDRSKKAIYSSAKVDPKANLYDDLMLVVAKIARKSDGKLLQDLIAALGDPRTKNLGVMFANYWKYRDKHELNQTTLKVKNPVFKLKVDRSQPDSGYNRSIQQRLFHIINNTINMKMCNKAGATLKIPLLNIPFAGPFKECELFEVKNGALFYMESIARLRDANGKLTNTPKGHLRLKTENLSALIAAAIKAVGPDIVLKTMTGIDGMSSHPTTEAVNRLMFMDPLPKMLLDVQDPAVDTDGHQVNKYHVGSLISWEVPHPQFSCASNDPCQFFDALRPVAQAFADHNSEQLFLDLVAVLHKHWPTKKSTTHQFKDPTKPDYAAGSAAVTYEPLLLELMEQSDLMPALNAVSPILDTLKLSNGKPAKVALSKSVAYLVDPTLSPKLTYRDGRPYSYKTDGVNKVTGGVSPYYLFADAFAAKNARLAALKSGPDKVLVDAWDASSSDLIDIFLDTAGSGAKTSFVNRRLVPAGKVLVDFLRARIKAHRAKGDLNNWLGKELPGDVEAKLAGPVVARASDFLRVVEVDPACKGSASAPCPREMIYDLVGFLIDELTSSDSFRATVVGIADLAQLLLDDYDIVPVVHTLGKLLEPEFALIKTALSFLKPAIAEDTRHSLSKILRNAYKEQSPGKSPMQTLFDLATELHRRQPGAGTAYTGPDFGQAFKDAREFLDDQDTGLVKFFEIVKSRCGGLCPQGK